MSNEKINYISLDTLDEEEENSLIKSTRELQIQTLYKILMKKPYLVNSTDDQKETILSYSLKYNNFEVSNLILAFQNIDLNYQDKDGNTYLHLSVIAKQKEIVKLLINKGISINKQNKDGNTALHLAYMINDNSIINILLEYGIDKHILNKDNKLAEELKLKKKKINAISNNKIKIIKNRTIIKSNRVINKKKENNNFSEKDIKSKAITNLNSNINNSNRKDYSLNKNIYNILTSSKSGINVNEKTIKNQHMKKNLKYNFFSNNDESEQSFYDFISLGEDSIYKNSIINIKNPECEKNINLDWNITNKNNISKENDDEKYMNYRFKENKFSYEKDQELCNIGENSSFYNEKNYNVNNNINYSNTIKNKNSSKLKQNIKGKDSSKKNNKNNSLENSIGFNSIVSGLYTASDNLYNMSQPNNNFRGKLDISSSQNNEIKTNKIHDSDNFVYANDKNCISLRKKMKNLNNEKNLIGHFQEINKNIKENPKKSSTNMVKNNQKRKTATSITYRKIKLSSKKSNDKKKKLKTKSSNISLSLISQNKLNQKKNNPLIEFLSQINLLKYLNNFESNGFDDINLLIEETKRGDIIKDQELKEAGINLPGDRAKILIRLKEKANIFGFSVPKNVYHTCKNFDDLENDENIINLNNWLSYLKLENYLMNFVNSGYHSIDLLLMQMETESPLTTEILRDEIGIDKIGFRSRILNKLKDEGRSLNNKLKTSVLIINNQGDDKNCNCFIF